MRRNVNRQSMRRHTWAQLGIGAGALLLPPLALGAALYSMLAPPVEDTASPNLVQTAAGTAVSPDPPEATGPPAPPAAAPEPGNQPKAGNSTADALMWDSIPQAQSGQFQIMATSTAAVPLPANAAGSAVSPGAAGRTLPPGVEGVRRTAAPRKPLHRHVQRQPQQEAFSLKNWLQQIGILPRSSNTRGG